MPSKHRGSLTVALPQQQSRRVVQTFRFGAHGGQHKRIDTSSDSGGGLVRNYLRLLPIPSYPALLLSDTTLRGTPTAKAAILYGM